MNVELQITTEVYVATWANTYELEVTYMHGDANAYSTEINYYDNNETEELAALDKDLKGLHFMQNLMRRHTDAAYQKTMIIEFFEKLGYPSVEDEDEDSDTYLDILPHPDVKEFLDYFMQQDTTDDSYEYNAIVKEVYVYYYDEAGTKFNVNVTFN